MADTLLSTDLANGRLMAETVTAGEYLEVDVYGTDDRCSVRVVSRPSPRTALCLFLTGPKQGETDHVNLFWGQYHAMRIAAPAFI